MSSADHVADVLRTEPINSELASKEYAITFEGEQYTLALKKAPDGYVPAFIRNAATNALKQFIESEGEFAFTTREADRFYSLIVAHAEDSLVKHGAQLIPIPWKHWIDLDGEVLDEIRNDFFLYALSKIKKYGRSVYYTQLAGAVEQMCELLTGTTITQ